MLIISVHAPDEQFPAARFLYSRTRVAFCHPAKLPPPVSLPPAHFISVGVSFIYTIIQKWLLLCRAFTTGALHYSFHSSTIIPALLFASHYCCRSAEHTCTRRMHCATATGCFVLWLHGDLTANACLPPDQKPNPDTSEARCRATKYPKHSMTYYITHSTYIRTIKIILF